MPKWMDSLKVIAGIAPMIAAAAGGPLAGTAVTAMESVLGLHPTTPDLPKRQDAVAAALADASPDTLLALKKADQEFTERMSEIGFADVESLAKIASEDRLSARQREMTVHDWTPKALALGVTAGFFGLLFWIRIGAVPAESKDLLNIMVGALGTAWVGIINYYFGSSAGSDRKTDLMAQPGKNA